MITNLSISSTEVDPCASSAGDYRHASMKLKRRCFLAQDFDRNQSRMSHVVVVRAKRNEVSEVVCATVLSGNQMMNRSHYVESTDHTPTAIANPCGFFAKPVCSLRPTFQRPSMVLNPALLRAKALSTIEHLRRDFDFLSADVTRVTGLFVKRMTLPCPLAPELITAIRRAVLACCHIGTRLESFPAMLALVNRRRLPSSSTIMTRNKHFAQSNFSATPALALC